MSSHTTIVSVTDCKCYSSWGSGRGRGVGGVLVQTAKGLGDNGLWRIGKLNGILYLLDVGSKTTSFSSACAGIFASN